MTKAHPTSGTGGGGHLDPVLDRQRLVVGMDELERAATHHLLAAPAEDLLDRLIDLQDDPHLVLAHRGEAGRELL